MTEEHKAALARGRNEARAIKRYLQALGARRPGRPARPETLRKRITDLEARVAAEGDPLKRVELIQRRLDAATALQAADAHSAMAESEAAFVEAVASYSDRKGITYAAWREAGVPASVLRRAGVKRSD